MLASTCAWTSVPKLAISLSGAGCLVDALIPGQHPLNHTLAVRRRFRYRATRPLRSLASAIEAARPRLIIACDERAVEHLRRLHARTGDDEVRGLIERSLGDPRGYSQSASRMAAIALAAACGAPVVETAAIETPADLRAWSQTHPLPWVLKVDGSWGGLGVRIVHSMAAAERTLAVLARPYQPLRALRWLLRGDPFWMTAWLHSPPRQITVQPYIAGRPANCVLATWNGETLSGVAVEVVATDGETGPASIVRVANESEMLRLGARLAKALGISGLVGFDFVIDPRTGRPLFLELNARATPIGHLRLGAGHDPVGALVDRLTGRRSPEHPAETQCDTIALFPQAELQFSGQPILAEAYQDKPVGEARLIRALLRHRTRQRRQLMFTTTE